MLNRRRPESCVLVALAATFVGMASVAGIARASGDDVVYRVDRTSPKKKPAKALDTPPVVEVRGDVTAMTPGTSVEVRTTDGKTVRIPWADVKRISTGLANAVVMQGVDAPAAAAPAASSAPAASTTPTATSAAPAGSTR